MIKIPVSADASSSIAALDQMTAALRRAGQEGRKFSEIDFSHDEIKPFADDLKRMEANFQEMKKVGRGATAAAVRKGGYDNVVDWHRGNARQFPDEKQRRNHQASVGNYVAQGTRYEGGGEGGGGGGGPGGFGGIPMGGMGKLLGIGLGLAGIGKITSMLAEGIKGAQDEAVDLDTFKRMLNDTSTEFDGMRESVRAASEGLQITYQETVKLAQAFAKTSGYTDANRISEEVETSTGFARAFGMDAGKSNQLFGQARWLQAGGGPDTNPKELAMLFADAIAGGNMWGKADEVMGAIVSWVSQSEKTMVDAPNVKEYADMTSTMNTSGRPGLRGAAGAALISAMDASFRAGGGAGDAGQNFTWRAINNDGNMNPWEMRLQREKGMFGELEDGRTNYEAINALAEAEYDDPLQRDDAMANYWGTSMSQMKAMRELGGVKAGGMGSMLNRYDIDTNDIQSTAYQGLADVSQADDAKLESLRTDTLKRTDLTTEQRKKLEGATSGEPLREELAKTLAALGRESNEGMKTLTATVEMKNALTDAGGPLLSPINAIKDIVSRIAGAPGAVSKFMDEEGPALGALAHEGLSMFYGGLWGSDDKRPANANPGDGSGGKVTGVLTIEHRDTAGKPLVSNNLPTNVVLRAAE